MLCVNKTIATEDRDGYQTKPASAGRELKGSFAKTHIHIEFIIILLPPAYDDLIIVRKRRCIWIYDNNIINCVAIAAIVCESGMLDGMGNLIVFFPI
jgi:hypothetical protein